MGLTLITSRPFPPEIVSIGQDRSTMQGFDRIAIHGSESIVGGGSFQVSYTWLRFFMFLAAGGRFFPFPAP